MREFSFEIRTDDKLGKTIKTDGQHRSASRESGHATMEVNGPKNPVRNKKRFGVRKSALPSNSTRASAPNQPATSMQRKLSWGMLAKPDAS